MDRVHLNYWRKIKCNSDLSFDDNRRVGSREERNSRVSCSLKCHGIIHCIGLSCIPLKNNHNVGEEGIKHVGSSHL